MSDTLVVCYSLGGNSAFAAEEAAGQLGADILRLVPEKEPPKKGPGKFLIGGKSALFKDKVVLKPLDKNAADYANVVIAAPVWAGTYPPAVGSWLREQPIRGKNVWLIVSSAGGRAQGFAEKLTAALDGNTVKGTLSLTSPLRDRENARARVKDFCAAIKG